MSPVVKCEVDHNDRLIDQGVISYPEREIEFATIRVQLKNHGIFYLKISRLSAESEFEPFTQFIERFIQWIESQQLNIDARMRPVHIARYLHELTSSWRVSCEF